MSERNGDKARFQRQRKHMILHRVRIRELWEALGHHKAAKENAKVIHQRATVIEELNWEASTHLSYPR